MDYVSIGEDSRANTWLSKQGIVVVDHYRSFSFWSSLAPFKNHHELDIEVCGANMNRIGSFSIDWMR